MIHYVVDFFFDQVQTEVCPVFAVGVTDSRSTLLSYEDTSQLFCKLDSKTIFQGKKQHMHTKQTDLEADGRGHKMKMNRRTCN